VGLEETCFRFDGPLPDLAAVRAKAERRLGHTSGIERLKLEGKVVTARSLQIHSRTRRVRHPRRAGRRQKRTALRRRAPSSRSLHGVSFYWQPISCIVDEEIGRGHEINGRARELQRVAAPLAKLPMSM
jgi:hypothetical protein